MCLQKSCLNTCCKWCSRSNSPVGWTAWQFGACCTDTSSSCHWQHCNRWWQTDPSSARCWSSARLSCPPQSLQRQFAERGCLDVVKCDSWKSWANSGCCGYGSCASSHWANANCKSSSPVCDVFKIKKGSNALHRHKKKVNLHANILLQSLNSGFEKQ